MKTLSLVLLLFLSSCATLDIMDMLTDPIPVCDLDSAGTYWEGKVCLKYSDGSYQWTWTRPEGK